MQRAVRKVVVLGTGGTIAGTAATPTEHLRYASAQLGIAALVAAAPAPAGVAVETEQVAQLDSKDMDFQTWHRLAAAAARQRARADVAGIVVTHGTDTLEETAYFLARVLGAGKPVVLTGAMRPATSSEADGPRNLGDAVGLAAAPDARRAGVVVVFDGQVHAARDVRKVHPSRLDAFASGQHGALGRVADGRIELRRPWPELGAGLGLDLLPDEPSGWPWVEIVTGTAGADGRVVDALRAAGVAGIIVASTGNGTLHARLAAALARAQEAGVAVLRSTRTLDGAVVDDGVPFASAGDLLPVKARVELILTLLAKRR
jgi:L-asparaginase